MVPVEHDEGDTALDSIWAVTSAIGGAACHEPRPQLLLERSIEHLLPPPESRFARSEEELAMPEPYRFELHRMTFDPVKRSLSRVEVQSGERTQSVVVSPDGKHMVTVRYDRDNLDADDVVRALDHHPCDISQVQVCCSFLISRTRLPSALILLHW